MVQPTAATTLQRPDLGQEIWEVDPNKQQFIADEVMPIFETPKKAANFSKVPAESLLKAVETRRSPGSGYNRTGWEFETDNYSCVEDGLEQPIPDEDVEHYATYFDVEVANARIAQHRLALANEKQVASVVFEATQYSAAGMTSAVATEWDTVATADPILCIENAKESIRQKIGIAGNAMVISQKVMIKLRRNTKLLSYLKYQVTTGGLLSDGDVRAALNLEHLFVGGGVKDSTLEGIDKTMADIWDDEYALVFYRPPEAELGDIKTPCLGRNFLWTGDSPTHPVVETYYENQTRQNVVRVREYTHKKIILVEAGYLLSNIHT